MTKSTLRIRRNYTIILAAAAAAAGLIRSSGSASAASLTWTGGGGSDNWSDTLNWGGATPNGGDSLSFGGTTRLTPNNDAFGGVNFNSITFNAAAGAFVLGGNGITLGAPSDGGGGNQSGGGIVNNDGAGVTQTIDMNLTLAAGRHNFSTNTASGGLAFGTVSLPISITRSQGAMIVFTTSGGAINFTNSSGISNDGSGIIGAYATIGNDWAALDGSQNVVAYTGYTDLAAGGQVIANNPTSNVRLTGITTSSSTMTGGTVINTIMDQHTDTNARTVTAAGTVKLGGAGSNTGGIYRAGNAASNFTLTGGTVTANGGGELTFSDATFTATANNLTVASIIANDGGNNVSVNTLGYVSISAANTFTGGVTIGQGRFQAGNATSFGAAASVVTVLPGGQAFLNAGSTFANPFVISGVGPTETNGGQNLGAVRLNQANAAISGQITLAGNARVSATNLNTLSGRITGNGRLEITNATQTVATTAILQLSNSTNDWQGGLLITNAGNADRAITVRLNNTTVLPDANDVTLNGVIGAATLDINARNEAINGLTAANSANNIVTNSSTAGTLTIGAADGSSTFGGRLTGANLNIAKTGAGTLTLTSASTNNTFTGTATVNNGTLLLNPTTGQNNLSAASIVTTGSGVLNVSSVTGGFVLGSQTLTNNAQVTGAVTAPNGSTVKGTGTFNSLLTLSGSGPANGGILSPGNSIGNINLSSGLTVSGGGQLSIELDGATTDLASVTGTAAVGGMGINISVLNNNPPPVGSYTVLSATTLTGTPVMNTPTIGRQTFSINGPALATNIIQIDVTGAPASLRWDNSVGGGDGINWEASTAANRKNWVNTGTGLADWFFQSDSVLFNDTNNGKYAVTVPGTVNAGSIAVTNNSGNYSFSGPGSIAGGALTKSGNSALTISTTGNTYSGGTVVNAGTLNMGGLTSTQLSLGTGALTIGNGVTIDNVSGITNTIANNIPQNWNGNFTFTGTNSLNMGTGAITLGSNPVNMNVAKNTLTVAGVIGDGAGSQVVTKSGTGTLVITGASTFQGPFNISNGIVTVGSANGSSTSSLGGITGGNVTISPGATLNLAGVAANNGLNFGAKVFHVSGTGFNNLGAITNRDLSNPPGSVTTVGQQNTFQQIVLDGNTTIGNPGNGPDGGAAVRIDMRSTTGAHGAVLNLNGFDLTHLGNSKFTMVNTDVNGTGNLICFSDTTVALATGQSVGGSFAFEAGTQILDDGGTSKIIMHDQTLLGFFNNGATGATSVTRRVEMGDGTPTSFAYIANGGGASSIGSNILLKGNLIVRSTFDNFNNNPLTLSGTISQDATARKLQKVNFNILELAATTQNTFTGGLEIAPGAGPTNSIGTNPGTSTVQLDSQLALDSSNVVSFNLPATTTAASTYSGVLQLNGADVTIGGLTTSFAQGTQSAYVQNITGTAALTVNNATNNTFGGVIRDNGGVMGLGKSGAGTLILTSANTYTGTTTINSGTLQVGNNGTSGALGTGPVVVSSTLAFNRTDNLTFAGSISGAGTVTQNTAGTLTLSGANTHASTTINNGTLVIPQPATHSGAVNFGGAGAVFASDSSSIGTVNLSNGSMHPGSTAADGVVGSVTIGSLNVTGGDLRLDIDTSDSSPGANDGNHDKIAVTNASFTAPSTISPFFLDGTPSAGNYTLITSTNAMTHTVNPTISGGGGSRLTFTPQFLSGNTVLNLNITGSGADKTWVGNISNVWNVNATANWSQDLANGVTDNLFFNLDSSTLDDTASGSHSLVLGTTNITPSRIVVNTGSNYTIDTNGKQITGVATSITVQSGQLILKNTGAAASNTFAGPINLGSGTTLELQAGGTIGTGAIGATDANLKVNRSGSMTIGQTITGNVNLTVDSGGDVTLGGANAIPSGNITVANGALRAATATALPATAANISLGSGANSGLLDLGGNTVSGITNLNTSGTGTTNSITNNSVSTAATLNFIGSGTPSTFNGTINSGTGSRAVNLNMTGGSLTLAGGSLNTSSGAVSVMGSGVLTIGTTTSIPSGALTIGQRVGIGSAGNEGSVNLNNSGTVSSLTIPANSTATNVVTVAGTKTLTVGGTVRIGTAAQNTGDGILPTTVTFSGGGSLVVNGTNPDMFLGLGDPNLGGGDHNRVRVDMTGLASFSFSTGATGTGRFGVGWMTRPDTELRLPPGANLIQTNSFRVADSSATPGSATTNNNAGSLTTLFLGAGTNTINTPTILVGAVKGQGKIDWVSPTSGSVTIRGQDGTASSRADLTVGSFTSGSATTNASSVLFAGHQTDANIGTLIIGRLNGSTGSALNNTMTFDTGTMNVNNFRLGSNEATASPNGADGTFTMGTSSTSTGTLTVNTQFALGLDTNTAASPTKARFNLLGGTANINTNLVATTNDTDTGNVFQLTIDGGTLDMLNHNIGSATTVSIVAASGVLKNVVQINNGVGFTKNGTTGGTLVLDGVNTFTGPTAVTNGTLQFNTSYTTGSSLNVSDGSVAYIKPSLATPNNVVVRTGSVSTNAAGKVDVGNNKMIVTGAGATGTWNGANYTGVTGQIATGKGSTNLWDGPSGIVTSQTQAIGSNFHSVGVAQASVVRPSTATATGLWGGQTITGTDTLVMYTYGGDANLDGKINVDDYIKIDSGISAGLTGWANGDFNYDGKVNIDDYTTVIDANIGNQTGAFPAAGGLVGGGSGSGDVSGVSAVPEPASVAVVGLGAAIGVLGRRRRRSM